MKIIKPSRIMMFDYRFDTDEDKKNIAKILNSKLDKEKYKYSTYAYFDNFKFKLINNEYLCVLEIFDVTTKDIEDNVEAMIELSDGNLYKFHIMFINYNRLSNQNEEKYKYYLNLLNQYR